MTTTGVEHHDGVSLSARVGTTPPRIGDASMSSSSKKVLLERFAAPLAHELRPLPNIRLGRGLRVARRITGLLGGTIGVPSRVGVGSTFQVLTPFAGWPSRNDLQPARLETKRPRTTQEHPS